MNKLQKLLETERELDFWVGCNLIAFFREDGSLVQLKPIGQSDVPRFANWLQNLIKEIE